MNDISDYLFAIISAASGKYLTVPGNTPEDWNKGRLEIQSQSRKAPPKGGPGDVAEQCWQLIPVGPGVFKIISVRSNKVLEVRGASKEDHAVIQQNTHQGGVNQHWVLVLVDDIGPSFLIFSELSKKVLDVPFPSTEDSVTIQQYTRKFRQAANQHWILNMTEIQVEG